MSESRVGEATSAGHWVVGVPLLCAVHCLAAPILLVVAPSFVRASLLEAMLILVAAGVTLAMIARGVREHANRWIWVPVVLGIGVWGLELARANLGVSGPVLTIAGSLLLASGLSWNLRLRRVAGSACGCPVHREG